MTPWRDTGEYLVPAFPGKDTVPMTVAEQADETAVRSDPVHTRALIIGTGFSGLGMAIALILGLAVCQLNSPACERRKGCCIELSP